MARKISRGGNMLKRVTAIAATTMFLAASPAGAMEKLVVMISGGFSLAYKQVLPEFERSTGISVTTLSGAMAACAGVISVWYTGYLDPGSAFDLKVTISAQIAPLFGGLYTIVGPVIGSIAVMALSELTRLYFNYSGGVGLLVYGGVLVFGVLAMPRGLVGLWERWTKRASKEPSLAAGAK